MTKIALVNHLSYNFLKVAKIMKQSLGSEQLDCQFVGEKLQH
jgi:hypothetical protein